MNFVNKFFFPSIAAISLTIATLPNTPSLLDKKIFITTVPKAGTGLISKLVELITNRKPVFPRELFILDELTLEQINDQMFITSHAIYKETMKGVGAKGIFLLRDPRDLVVSLAHWIQKTRAWPTEISDLPIKQLITKLIHEARFLIIGTHKTANTIDALYREDYLPWMRQPHIYTTKFEKIIGINGGGSTKVQLQEIAKIAHHFEICITQQQAEMIAKFSFGDSGTFREGKIGSWKKYFTPQHKAEFKKVAGKLLIELGYEKNLNW